MQKLREPLPLITRQRIWARWEMPTLFGLLAVYVALATYKIHLPGLYCEEILFVGPAHHVVMLFPFNLLACFSAAFLFANTFQEFAGRLFSWQDAF
jgi:hypothetical protein